MNEDIKEPIQASSNNKILLIIIPVLILVAVFLFLFFGTDMFKSKKNNNNEEETPKEQPIQNVDASKFEGIYVNENDKLFIRKISDTEFSYTLGGNFAGFAKITGNKAKQSNSFDDENDYFEFTLVGEDVNVEYINEDENTSVAAETGLYKRVADYSKDNIYQYAVGDPKYLETRYNGIYKNGDIELFVYQISENEVMVVTSNNTDDVFMDEKFEIEENNIHDEVRFISKSIFDEDEIAYRLNFYDRSIEIIVYADIFGVNEEDKKLENNYKFDRKITKEDILNEFYSYY